MEKLKENEELVVISLKDIPDDFSGKVLFFKNQIWFKNRRYHRDDGPAIIDKYGKKYYFLNGLPFKNKEDWFDSLDESQKNSLLWNLHNI